MTTTNSTIAQAIDQADQQTERIIAGHRAADRVTAQAPGLHPPPGTRQKTEGT